MDRPLVGRRRARATPRFAPHLAVQWVCGAVVRMARRAAEAAAASRCNPRERERRAQAERRERMSGLRGRVQAATQRRDALSNDIRHWEEQAGRAIELRDSAAAASCLRNAAVARERARVADQRVLTLREMLLALEEQEEADEDELHVRYAREHLDASQRRWTEEEGPDGRTRAERMRDNVAESAESAAELDHARSSVWGEGHSAWRAPADDAAYAAYEADAGAGGSWLEAADPGDADLVASFMRSSGIGASTREDPSSAARLPNAPVDDVGPTAATVSSVTAGNDRYPNVEIGS